MENQKELEDKLWKIFANVNDWLKFAEAKNAMLIGFNGASIFGLSRIMVNCSDNLKWYLIIVSIFFGASLITSLISFVPRLSSLSFSDQSDSKMKNIYYFEYLKTLGSQTLLEEISQKEKDYKFPDSLKNLGDQIISNSKIASLKYSYFSVAIWITICGIVTLIVGALLFGYWYAKK
jgi:hypothetical protein